MSNSRMQRHSESLAPTVGIIVSIDMQQCCHFHRVQIGFYAFKLLHVSFIECFSSVVVRQ